MLLLLLQFLFELAVALLGFGQLAFEVGIGLGIADVCLALGHAFLQSVEHTAETVAEGRNGAAPLLGYHRQRAVAHHVVEQLDVSPSIDETVGHSQTNEAAQQLRYISRICKVIFLTSVYRGGGKLLIFRLLCFKSLCIAIGFV